MDIYYVYLLLDPRKFYAPFYVGKGKKSRCKNHFTPSSMRQDRNKLKTSIILKIRKIGEEASILIWENNLSQEAAFELEKELIARFGRRNNETGILANLTDGGDGNAGVVITDKTRKRMSIRSANSVWIHNDIEERFLSVTQAQELLLDGFERGRKPGSVHMRNRRNFNGKNNPSWGKTREDILARNKLPKKWVTNGETDKQILAETVDNYLLLNADYRLGRSFGDKGLQKCARNNCDTMFKQRSNGIYCSRKCGALERLEVKTAYSLISPSGELFEGENICSFAQEHDLISSRLREVMLGKHKHHRGWKSQ